MLDQHLTSMIEKTGVPAKYIAMAAPDLIDFDPILDQMILSFVSPIETTSQTPICLTLNISDTQ